MSYFLVGELLSTIGEAITFFLLYESFLKRKKDFSFWWIIFDIIVVAILIFICNRFLLFTLENAIGMIVIALLGSFLYRGSFLVRILATILALVIGSISEIFVLYSITFVLHLSVIDAIEIPEYRFLGIILAKTLAVSICNIIRMKCNVKQSNFKLNYLLLFLLLFSNAVIVVFLFFRMTYELQSIYFDNLVIFSSVGLFGSVFIALYLYEHLSKQNEVIRNQEQAEQQMSSQIKHMDELILKQNELRSMRHDMNAHLIALKGFFDTNDLISGQRYLSGLVDQFQGTIPTINTGNNALDAIISAKQSLAERKKITFTSEIRVQESINIDEKDLSIIFGNALDNAIEACERLKDGEERKVDFVLTQTSQSLFCKITNTAHTKEKDLLITSKQDKLNHGFGVRNIKDALEKYNAIVNFEQKKGMFIFSFVIYF